mgnify:CR=1 FL=1
MLPRFGLKSRDMPHLMGMTTYPRTGKVNARVWINLRAHHRRMQKRYRSLPWMLEELIKTVDHELVHAFLPEEEKREERLAKAFERAGNWARR